MTGSHSRELIKLAQAKRKAIDKTSAMNSIWTQGPSINAVACDVWSTEETNPKLVCKREIFPEKKEFMNDLLPDIKHLYAPQCGAEVFQRTPTLVSRLFVDFPKVGHLFQGPRHFQNPPDFRLLCTAEMPNKNISGKHINFSR